MKVLAVKDVEEYDDLWAVRYTRLTRRGVKQGAVFLYHTPEEARAKYQELLLCQDTFAKSPSNLSVIRGVR
jgi:hypothetical protein